MGNSFRGIMGLVATLFTLFVIALLIGVFTDGMTTWNLIKAFFGSGYNLAAHLVMNAVGALQGAWS